MGDPQAGVHLNLVAAHCGICKKMGRKLTLQVPKPTPTPQGIFTRGCLSLTGPSLFLDD